MTELIATYRHEHLSMYCQLQVTDTNVWWISIMWVVFTA